MDKIEKLRLVYDNKAKKFTEAYALVNEFPYQYDNDKEIRKLIEDFKAQENVERIGDADPSKYDLVFPNRTEAIESFRKEFNALIDERVESLKFVEENEFDGQEVVIPAKKNNLTTKLAILGTTVAIAAATIAGCSLFNSNAKKDTQAVETQVVIEDNYEVKEKINPKTWEDYTENFSDSLQKQLLTSEMDQITSNIVTMTINSKEYKVALSPAEITALNYYYNSTDKSNEDLLRMYGDYNLNQENGEDLINDVHDGLNKIRLSLVKATKAEDVLRFKFDDETSQKLFDKYADLIVKYNNAEKKSEVKKEMEDALKADFIENGSVDLKEHPSATVVLQVIPSAMNLKLDPIAEKLNIILVGTETNYKVDGVENSVAQNGLVDSACSVVDRRLEKFDENRSNLKIQKTNDENYNELLHSQKSAGLNTEAEYKVSEYDELTKDTYELTEVMIPIMNEYLSKNYDLSVSIEYDDLNEEITKEMIAELQAKQLNNTRKWDIKTNPAGGKVGDVLTGETTKGVKVTESELSKTEKGKQQMEAAKQEYLKNNKDGVVIDGTNPDEVKKKDDEIKKDYTALCQEAYSVGQKETISQGASAPINSKYANHEQSVVRNAYNEGRNNGIKVYNEMHNSNNTVKPVTPTDENGVGNHKDNPNQNGNSQTQTPTTPTVETIVVPQPSQGENTTVTPVEDTNAGNHQDNPNQSQNNVSYGNVISNIDISGVVSGTITLNDDDVEDMSQYGEVQGMTR